MQAPDFPPAPFFSVSFSEWPYFALFMIQQASLIASLNGILVFASSLIAPFSIVALTSPFVALILYACGGGGGGILVGLSVFLCWLLAFISFLSFDGKRRRGTHVSAFKPFALWVPSAPRSSTSPA